MIHRHVYRVLLLMVFMSLAWAAPDASPRYGLSIRAGLALDEALQELARQTGIQVVFLSRITAGRSAPELSGEYTIPAAMTRLLEGSDLTFRIVNEHTVEVREAPPRSAQSGSKAQPSWPAPPSAEAMQEVQVTATAEQLVATRIPTPLQEIPQTVTVISSEQIREENVVDLGDLLQNTPGVAERYTSSLAQVAYSRGFEVLSYHVDGGGALKPSINRQILYQGGDPDLSEFDRVEVLRGSDALFGGNSNPGATVSLVRKRPLATPSFAMSATLGSWNNYRIELDASGPLADDGALRARADVVYAKRDYFFDRAYLDRKKVFGAVEYDITPTSTLTAGGSYQWDNSLPLATGVPMYANGSDSYLPRSTSLTFDWAFYNTRIADAYLQYRQRFADDWILMLDTAAGRTTVDYGYGEFNDAISSNNGVGLGTAYFSTRPNTFTLGTIDGTLTGKLDWFGLRELVAIGGDFTRVRADNPGETYAPLGPPLTNVLTFNPALYPDPRGTKAFAGTDTRYELEQYGGFLSLQIHLNDAWALSAGARIGSDTLRFSSIDGFIAGVEIPPSSREWGSSHVVQPYAALMYRINEHLSWYASYADIYLSLENPYVEPNGRPLGPEHGVTYESGIKGAWRDGKLNAFLAVYEVEQRGVPVVIGELNGTDCCYTTGTGRSRGVELELDGELAPGWLIGSGYTYNQYETPDLSIPVTSTPRHLLKIWTSARLPGGLSRWTLGGDLRAQTTARGSPAYPCDVSFQTCPVSEAVVTQPYAVLDLRVGFALDKNWQVALSVNNVLDKRYYVSQDTPQLDAWYGEPRNFMLRIDAKY